MKEKRRYLHLYKCKVCGETKNFIAANKNTLHTRICAPCYSQLNFNKSISLWNCLTNEKDSAESITKFCEKHQDLGKNAKHHFHEVLSGKRLHYKGWILMNNKVKLDYSKIRESCQIIIKPAIINN